MKKFLKKVLIIAFELIEKVSIAVIVKWVVRLF